MQTEDKRRKQSVDLASLEPSARVKQLASYGTMVEVDPNVPPRRYYRSGLEMVRMANVYLAEGSLENAYILYMKFMTLFLEKIRKHPEYANVPAQVKAVNQSKLKEEVRRQEEERRKKQEIEDAKLALRLQADEDKKDTHPHPHLLHDDAWAASPSLPAVDGVRYPDDFAAEPPRAPPHHYQPVPPLIPPSRPHKSPKGAEIWADHMQGSYRPVNNLSQRFTGTGPAYNHTRCGPQAVRHPRLVQHQQRGGHLPVSGPAQPDHTRVDTLDLHTQCSYQLMMPEAIAIVCAPKYNE
ncbi:Amsh [Operophtera brumata]|uniref:Amsh n=1 Tax=Operophtera brumata TaxID=104452 RepID=A0A0L7KRZ6_OPEBR|nr:Amsh [Operophtera brumata]